MTPNILWLFLSLELILTSALAIVKLPKNARVPAVFMFGDSIVDTGNNNNLTTFLKSNFPPYGRDFLGGAPTGRFCNGKIPSDFVVEELGIKEYLPAYLNPRLQATDLLTGVNFASSGSGFDPLTSTVMHVMPLSEQLDMLKECIEKLNKYVGEEKANNIISNSLFMVETGSDDIVNTYYHTPTRFFQYDIHGYTDLLLSEASVFVQKLYELGARRIGILSLPPIGCIPSQRTLAGGTERTCAKKYNDAAELFNTKLSTMADSKTSNLPDARVVYMDTYNPFLHILQNIDKYGN
ncbi:GDSL esterase/lipase EXL3-like [Argentina anserina]|uniref:GDSL esterase/lipase EXL3-like n=1 Tax=Argentina anserina TaxID=57926 RepID=UPI0021764E3D|nr:GDSL esterase/lipase EXL3-like [Potentilla anserina]